jgi:hypothetical protein
MFLALQLQKIPHNGIYIQSNIYFYYPRHLLVFIQMEIINALEDYL